MRSSAAEEILTTKSIHKKQRKMEETESLKEPNREKVRHIFQKFKKEHELP